MREKFNLYTGVIILLTLMFVAIIVVGEMKDNKQSLKVASLVKSQQKLTSAKDVTSNSSAAATAINTSSVYEKLYNKQSISILIIGDLIADSDGVKPTDKWNVKLSNNIETAYGVKPSIKLLTSSNGNALNRWSQYLSSEALNKYDLVLLCYGENDINDLTLNQFQSLYENIIREIKTNNAVCEIYPIIESSFQVNKDIPAAITAISNNYNLTLLDMRDAYKNANADYKTLTTDGILPSSAGCDIYSSSIMNLIKTNINNFNSKKVISNGAALKDALYSNTKDFNTYKLINTFDKNSGFTLNQDRWTSSVKLSNLTTKFTGNFIGANLEYGPDCGRLAVYVDNKLMKEFDCYSPAAAQKQLFIADNLDSKQHSISLTIERVKSAKSSGYKINLSSLFTN